MPAGPGLPIRRNTALLSASPATRSAMLQLSAAVASLTLVLVLDIERLLGLAESAPRGIALVPFGAVFGDLLSGLTGAALEPLGGVALSALGAVALPIEAADRG